VSASRAARIFVAGRGRVCIALVRRIEHAIAMTRLPSFLLASATLALTASSSAAPRHVDDGSAVAFRDQGTLAISVTNGGSLGSIVGSAQPTTFLFWGHTSGDSDDTVRTDNLGISHSHSTSEFLLNPGFDYFVIDGLSVGGEVLYDHRSTSNSDTVRGTTTTTDTAVTNLGIAPRVGYDIALTEGLSLWIRGGIGYTHESASQQNATASRWAIGVDAQLLWHIHPHFFAGIGPGVSRELSSSQSADLGNGTTQTSDQPKNTHWRFLTFTLGGSF
jgi:hypothetical protein